MVLNKFCHAHQTFPWRKNGIFNGATTGKMELEPLWAPVTMIASKFFEVDFSTDAEPLLFNLEAYLELFNRLGKQFEQDLQATIKEEFNAL